MAFQTIFRIKAPKKKHAFFNTLKMHHAYQTVSANIHIKDQTNRCRPFWLTVESHSSLPCCATCWHGCEFFEEEKEILAGKLVSHWETNSMPARHYHGSQRSLKCARRHYSESQRSRSPLSCDNSDTQTVPQRGASGVVSLRSGREGACACWPVKSCATRFWGEELLLTAINFQPYHRWRFFILCLR